MDTNLSLNLSTLSKELRLILEIMKTKSSDSIEPTKKEMFKDIDWDLFLKISMHHRVYPILYSQLKMIDSKLVPPYVFQILNREYKKNTFQMLQLSGEMEQISKLFIENQIQLLFLKGPVIAYEIYGDISLRTSKDLDILIPISKLEKAEELLLNFGYERVEETTILNEVKWRGYHLAYFNPQKNIELEIHWRLQPLPSQEPNFKELWERKRGSSLTSYPVYYLGKEDLILYLVSHGSRHGWFRLRWLLDIDYLLGKGLDLEKASKILNKYSSYHLLGQTLILVSELLKTPINKELQIFTEEYRSKKLAQSAVFFINQLVPLETIMSSTLFKRYIISLRSSNFQKFIYILLLSYPSSVDANTLRLPKTLHFLYFPLRPLLWIWRRTKIPLK
ncbi:nucleotidyltransferase domain-containing protein [Peribacillus frigoritolerans]|uniref:nucleotidyltransferase domain-containing protein n=1 Tax=Peribacillus frigoritolerans TaxID=450367 RepID=UPI0025A20A36|nr:nucleotidyltransferase family protein [Peribacillus frigoritolerans]MDM5313201.1 nucleotidyltransferase family protein [Peribacillus frigoritolerans]